MKFVLIVVLGLMMLLGINGVLGLGMWLSAAFQSLGPQVGAGVFWIGVFLGLKCVEGWIQGRRQVRLNQASALRDYTASLQQPVRGGGGRWEVVAAERGRDGRLVSVERRAD